MLRRLCDVNGRDPISVSLLINVFNCKATCAQTIKTLAETHENINIYVGYKHMHVKNLEDILEIFRGTSNLFFSDVSARTFSYVDNPDDFLCTFDSVQCKLCHSSSWRLEKITCFAYNIFYIFERKVF